MIDKVHTKMIRPDTLTPCTVAEWEESNRIPFLSIVIPTYNRAIAVCECIYSILANTFTDYEIIVVDDASTDNTESLLMEKFASIYGRRLRYIQNPENRSEPYSKNVGIMASCADWILILDSDNLLPVDTLQKLHDFFIKYPDFKYGGLLSYNVYEHTFMTFGGDVNWLTSRFKEFRKDLFYKGNIEVNDIASLKLDEYYPTVALAPNATFIHKSVIEKVKGYNTVYGIGFADVDFFVRLSRAGFKGAICGQIITFHMHFYRECKKPDIMKRFGIKNARSAYLGCTTSKTAYLSTRNRSWMMKYLAPWYGKIVYFLFPAWIPGLYYSFKALQERRFRFAWASFRGMLVGNLLSPPKPRFD